MAQTPVKAVATINAQELKICLYMTSFAPDTHEGRVPLNTQYHRFLAEEGAGLWNLAISLSPSPRELYIPQVLPRNYTIGVGRCNLHFICNIHWRWQGFDKMIGTNRQPGTDLTNNSIFPLSNLMNHNFVQTLSSNCWLKHWSFNWFTVCICYQSWLWFPCQSWESNQTYIDGCAINLLFLYILAYVKPL